MTILLNNDVTAQYGTIVYTAITSYRHLDSQNRTIANLHIMTQMHAVHQVILITNAGTSIFVCSPTDNHILTDVIVITDNQQAFFSFIVKILRLGSKYSTMIYLITLAHSCTIQDSST